MILSGFSKVLAVLTVVLMVIPVFIPSGFILDFLTLTLLFALIGQGWNVLGGLCGQFSFGHAIFFGVGAYCQIILQTTLGVNAWAAIPFSVLAGTLVGGFVGFLSFRYGLKGAYFALITLAFAEVMRIVATTAKPLTKGGQGIYLALNQDPENSLLTLQFVQGIFYYYWAVLLVILSLILLRRIENSRFGARLMAVRENEDAARSIGVPCFRVKMQAILLSGAITAAGGVFYAQKFLFIDPDIAFGPVKSVEMLIMPIIGGLGTLFGPLVGSALVHLLGEFSKFIAESVLPERPGIDRIVYGVMLVGVLVFMPAGVIGFLSDKFRLFRKWSGHA